MLTTKQISNRDACERAYTKLHELSEEQRKQVLKTARATLRVRELPKQVSVTEDIMRLCEVYAADWCRENPGRVGCDDMAAEAHGCVMHISREVARGC